MEGRGRVEGEEGKGGGGGRGSGNHPFGAILVDAAGAVLLEVETGFMPDRAMTGHAERLLATQASKKFGADFLAGCTLYTSAEPCAMCAGAISGCESQATICASPRTRARPRASRGSSGGFIANLSEQSGSSAQRTAT